MYKPFFALSEKPFSLTPDPSFLYLSRSHKEALAHLTYGVESKSGFVVVTGEVGAGKTTLLHTLFKNLGGNVVLSQVTNTRVSYKELLELILEDFGLNPQGLGKTALLSTLNEFLIEKFHEGKNCVLVVDEAQNLGIHTLEGLRMLSNLETEKAKLLHIILTGQPGLRDLIESPEIEQLRQRITVRYHLGPLSAGETGEYIRHRLAKVVTDPEKGPEFPDEVIPLIHQATGGIPRLVNVLCDAALVHGYVAETRVMTPEIIDEVAGQVAQVQKGRASKAAPETPPVDKQVERRIQEIETRLAAFQTNLDRPSRVVASSADLQAEVDRISERERALEAREKELTQRLAEVEQREVEMGRRLEKVREEWRKRMGKLEEARREALGGAVAFPPPKVYAYDPDPRVRNTLAELFASAAIEAEVCGNFDGMLDELQNAAPAGAFPIAVLGAGTNDAENVARVNTLSSYLHHVPTVFLSDIDLSTIRRKIFTAGANYFIEKPNGRTTSFVSHREGVDHMKNDLLRVVWALHRQYEAYFGKLSAGDERPQAVSD